MRTDTSAKLRLWDIKLIVTKLVHGHVRPVVWLALFEPDTFVHEPDYLMMNRTNSPQDKKI